MQLITALGGVRSSLFALLLLIVSFWFALCAISWNHRIVQYQQSQQKYLADLVAAQVRVRNIERQNAITMQTIGDRYAKAQAKSQAMQERMLADIHVGSHRLRPIKAGNQQFIVRETGATTDKCHAATYDRKEIAAAIVKAGRDADNQVAACQAVITAWTRLFDQYQGKGKVEQGRPPLFGEQSSLSN